MRVQKPRVKQDGDYSYTNKFTKKQLRFSPREDEVVATFQPQASMDAMRGLMSATSMSVSQGMDASRGFAVLKVPREKDLATAERSLEARPEVANVLPVLVDDEGLTRYFLPDELTVQFRQDVPRERIEQLLDEKKTPVVAEQRTPGYFTLAVPEDRGLFETLRELSALEEVAFAEPSEAGFNDALYVPDDPDFPVQWALHNTGQVVNGTAGSVDSDTDAVEAWDITRGHPDVIVAVIDTGMDLDHPDLLSNLLARGAEDWDFSDVADPSPDDTDGHGTHVSGTAAAVDNGTGGIGMAPRCRLMPLRINLTAGMNQNRADAINYVAAQATANPSRRYVINCSWKMSGDHAGVHNAIINAVNNNVVVVFAAGNNNQDIEVPPFYPAIYPEVIAVAATNQQDVRASFSNYGAKVDVSAPGVNIYSSYPDNGYAYLDGTSMASPHVAGLAALVWSRNRSLSNHKVRSIIESTCDNIDAKNPGFIGKLGKGRINAYRAVHATPLPPVKFLLLRKFAFPQKNDGSSSALAYARALILAGSLVPRSALLFLTQMPFSERIYYLNPTTGAVLGSIDPVANDTIGSMEWVGSRIRVANVTTGAGFINAIHPGTGAQVGSIPAPVGRGEGLAYDGTYLYYSTINRIHILNPTTGMVVGSFPAPGGTCRALAAGLGHLFCGNPLTGVISVVELSTRLVRDTFPAPGGTAERVDGLAFNPTTRELFIANQGENLIYVGQVTL